MSPRPEKPSLALRERACPEPVPGAARPAGGEPGEGAAAGPPHRNPPAQRARGGLRAWTRLGLLVAAVAIPAAALTGCGWEPLYADRAAGSADAELAAIKVAPIPERIGEVLALKLRQWLNPSGATAPTRYELRTVLQTTRLDLGILTTGLGTRARIDVVATYTLADSTTGTALFTGRSHASESFDILANYYANVVADEDARMRAVEVIRRDMTTQLTLFLQRRAAPVAAKQP